VTDDNQEPEEDVRRPNASKLGSDRGIEPDRLAALVRECISLMQSGDIVDLELKYEKLKLRLRAREGSAMGTAGVQQASSTPRLVTDPLTTQGDDCVITAPMIGTFYHAAAPGEPPFITQGDVIEEGQTIGIIEAMKIMNEIAADRTGVVEEIIAANGQTVEYGSPLVRLARATG
jgi:acetyl-CoA carboxylase biotin carboxyl carrier protein